jgi:ATP-dependent Clp protease adaptor protein ClpS
MRSFSALEPVAANPPSNTRNFPYLIGGVGGRPHVGEAVVADKQQGNSTIGVGTAVVTQTKTKTQKPSMYRVLILNDDYTPMEFVTYILERFFNKSRETALRIMLHVHQNGVGVCGVFTYEVAETKVAQVIETARRHQHPLQCTMEKD